MARAQPADDWHEPVRGQNPGDWQALRSDLINLLNEVDGQVARNGDQNSNQHANVGGTRSHFENRHNASAPNRHEEALQSVARAVGRVDGRNDDVQSAIAQISRQYNPPRQNESNQSGGVERLDGFSSALNGITDRLGRLENELGQSRHSTNDLHEISDQVAQLTQVVELLSGAVGESGQVKRLESQIANVAHLISEAPGSDFNEVAHRIDNLTDTVERLTDLQLQSAKRPAPGLEQLSAAHEQSMRSIETSVGNIYDRIDTIEKNYAVDPGDMERLLQGMASITADMSLISKSSENGATGGNSSGLLTQIDALNKRVSHMEDDDGLIKAFRSELESLRNSVKEALEPRFSALETRIDSLGDRIGSDNSVEAEVSVKQLETQIRQLVARMDQTGEQLTGLTRLYQNGSENSSAPDFEALADMIVKRTSAAIAKAAPKKTAASKTQAPDLDALAEKVAQRTLEEASRANTNGAERKEDGLSEIEARMSRLLDAVNNQAKSDNFADVQSGIKQVDERLARLETTLNSDAPTDQTVPEQAPELKSDPAIIEPETVPEFQQTVPDEPVVAREIEETTPLQKRLSGQSDRMRDNPSDDAPLVDRSFAPAVPSQAPDLSVPHPTTHDNLVEPASTQPDNVTNKTPHFDPNSVERPTKPKSVFAKDTSTSFDKAPIAPLADVQRPLREEAEEHSGKNTFIEAARRAAQKTDRPEAQSQSIIARAFSRFQNGQDEETVPKSGAGQTKDRKEQKRAEKERLKKAKAEERAEQKRESEAAKQRAAEAANYVGERSRPTADSNADINTEGEESFLLRYRRPILLAAAIVAIAFLSLDLIAKRIGTPATQPTSAATDGELDNNSAAIGSQSGPTSPGTLEPQALLDPAPTGSVDPFVRLGADNSKLIEQVLPSPLGAIDADMMEHPDGVETGSIDPLDDPQTNVVKFDLPHEEIGPLALREAAANGDPRAQFEVAAIYSEGQAITKDNRAAAIWYERAAAQGFAPAEYRLGGLYENGVGVETNLIQAKLWYQRAAEAGNRMAMHNLAALYAGGALGTQEFALAAEWFERAADRGLTDSQFNLGMLYARGLGFPQSLPTSYKWFSLAAAQGDADAAKARDDVARSLDSETVRRLQAEVQSWSVAKIDIKVNFAPIGTWAKDFNPGKPIGDSNIVERVQAALNRLGYNVGIPDGLMGPRTRDAILDFERETGMSQSGTVNPRLLAVLGSQPV